MKRIIISFLLAVFALFVSVKSVSALSISVHVPEKYTDVQAGERFYFEIEVKYPENPSRKDLRLTYEIKHEGKIVAQSKVLKAIETQASFVDFVVIPESAETGLHTIDVTIEDYDDLSEEVAASFHVIRPNKEIRTYFILIMSAIAFVAVLVVINITVSRRRG